MLKLRDWHISVPEGGVTVGFEGDNLMYRLEIDSDLGPEWLVKLDIQRGGAWDIIALEREGTKLYVDLTREMLGRHGAYTAQIRGMNGELEAHSERFYLRVRESVNALEGFPPCLPTELRQVEEKMEKMLETAETMGDDRYLKLTGGEIRNGNSNNYVSVTHGGIRACATALTEGEEEIGEIYAGGISVGGPTMWIEIASYLGGISMIDPLNGANAFFGTGLMEIADGNGHSVQIVSTAEGMQVLGNNSVYGLRDPEREDAAATKRYVDNTFLPRNGGVILEPENGYQINIMEPVEEYFTLPFEVWDNFSECMTGVGTGYIIFHDKKKNEWLIAESNDGRFLFYKLDQDKNTVPVVLTGVAAPEDDSDAANKGYVDNTFLPMESEKDHIIRTRGIEIKPPLGEDSNFEPRFAVSTEDPNGPSTEIFPNMLAFWRQASGDGIGVSMTDTDELSFFNAEDRAVRLAGLAAPKKEGDAATMGWVQERIGDIAAVLDAINGEVI